MPYRNFLNFNLRHKIDLRTAFLLAVALVTFIFYTRYLILGFFVFNVLSGPVTALYKLSRKASHGQKKREQTPC